MRKVLDWPSAQSQKEILEDGRQVRGLVSVLYSTSSPKRVKEALTPKLDELGGKYMIGGTALGGTRLILYPSARRTGKVLLQALHVGEGIRILRCREHFAVGGHIRPGVSAKDRLWEKMVASMTV